MKKKLVCLILLFVCYSFTYLSNALAVTRTPPKLRQVMARLLINMSEINQGIFGEDFDTIESSAREIAKHPKPTKQIEIIKGALGPKFKQFKKFDHLVHKSAKEMQVLAKKKNMDGIIKKYHVIMKNCAGCHSSFRKKVWKLL